MRVPSVVAGATLLFGAVQAGFYSKTSPVLQITGKTYDKLIAASNHTSIVEFYAPWCGHCQSLKPAYEKAARNLGGLANVAAIDCDDDANKQLCTSMGVQGFPTLKIVRPSRKAGGRPGVEDYQGARTATAIVEAVTSRINNHVVKVTDEDAEVFLASAEGPRALLFSEKGSASVLLRSLAIEFLGTVPVGQVRSKEAKTVERFGITSFPTLLLLPGGGAEPVVYEGEMTKAGIVGFLSQAAAPNSARAAAAKESPAGGGAKSKPAPPPPPPSAPAPVILDIPPIPTLSSDGELRRQCLSSRSHMCLLVFLPDGQSAKAHKALETLAGSAHRHAQGQHHFPPFYAVPRASGAAGPVLRDLGLDGDVEILAVNARRGWWRHYDGDFGTASVESWIDSIRMGEGTKSRLPEGLVGDEQEDEAGKPEASRAGESQSEQGAEPKKPEAESEKPEAATGEESRDEHVEL